MKLQNIRIVVFETRQKSKIMVSETSGIRVYAFILLLLTGNCCLAFVHFTSCMLER